MILKKIFLSNFRNYQEREFRFSPSLTLVVGPNTSGKTNLLEAIYLLSSGYSFRAENEREMIFYGSEISRVKGVVGDNGSQTTLEVVLTKGSVMGKKTAHKKRLVNAVSRRLVDFVGNLPSVLFWPQDLELVTDSPSLRRNYLNSVLVMVDREYRRSLAIYEKALSIRNKLLRDKREIIYGKKLHSGAVATVDEQIDYWGTILINNGQMVTKKREEYIHFMNKFKELKDSNLPAGEAGVKTSSKIKVQKIIYNAKYDKSEISQNRLEQYKEEEVLAGATLVGPHRDDFVIKKDQRSKIKDQNEEEKGKELSKFGSRGEQRLGVLWLKLAELAFVEEQLGTRPLLLLDDICSELDEEHRKLVMSIVDNQQSIITTTDIHVVNIKKLSDLEIIKI